jgi:Nucleoside-diphosphate-sugar pyrophosphorylase involved in lipopolysaccharide biosynthesis/translation initiation factor 2B, gamma/epsilon subunits (eIF-2Bgamma/eIF-2Bepsilon)
MKAMIFAAGLGTRLRPLTDTMPKALVPYQGKPMLQIQLEKLKAAGFNDIVINIFHFPEQIRDFLSANANFGLNISLSDETGLLRDTGGGLKFAAPLLDDGEPVLCHNVDIISNVDIRCFYDRACGLIDFSRSLEAADKNGGEVLAVPLVGSRKTSRYLLFDSKMYLRGWQNVKTGEYRWVEGCEGKFDNLIMLANAGIEVISPAIFKAMAEFPEKFSIIDFYLSHQAAGKVRCIDFPDLKLMDIGTADHLQQINN